MDVKTIIAVQIWINLFCSMQKTQVYLEYVVWKML